MVQAMDLPVDVWEGVRQQMHPRDWAKGCGTCRATKTLMRCLVAADIRSKSGDDEQALLRLLALLRRLQLDKGHGCHSLYLNLSGWHMHEPTLAHLNKALSEMLATSEVPSLRCLHITGMHGTYLMEGSIEGLLTRQLARHASVVTLELGLVGMPLDFPALQHLVLYLSSASHGYAGPTYQVLFPAARMLKGLKTLCIQSSSKITHITGPTDLACCPHLEHVAVQGIRLEGPLTLPAGCQFHLSSGFACIYEVTPAVAHLVDGLSLRHLPGPLEPYNPSCWHPTSLLRDAPRMCSLKRLRLTLDRDDLDDERWSDRGQEQILRLAFGPGETPGLEVLEVDVYYDLAVSIDPRLALKSVVLVSHMTLHLDELILCKTPRSTLEKMYLRSGTSFLPLYEELLKASHASESWAGILLKSVTQKHGAVHGDGSIGMGVFSESGSKEELDDFKTVRMPATFQPDLTECCCRACPQCLVQARVPILYEEACTCSGFFDLRHRCNKDP